VPTYLSGAQHTENILQDERKFDIDPEIYYLREDLTPLVVLTWGKGKDGLPIKKESVSDPEFKVFEKEPHGAWTAINYSTGYTAGATTLLCDTVSHIPIGAVLKAVGGEQLYVTARDTGANTITVKRGAGTTSAGTLGDNLPLYYIGNANAERATPPMTLKVQTRARTNYTQIFRETIDYSRTLQKTRLHTGNKVEDLRKEAWIHWREQVERMFIWGEPKEDVTYDADGYPTRFTGGLYYWINSTGNVTNISTTLTKALWMTFARNLFTYGSRRKVVLCAPIIIDALSYWKDNNLQFRPSDEVYGLRVAEWESGHGTMLIVRDQMLENSPYGSGAGYGGVAIGFDPEMVNYKYLQGSDASLLLDRVKTGIDGQVDEILGECGLGVTNPETGWLLTGVSAYS
jgi:hypothetical protein